MRRIANDLKSDRKDGVHPQAQALIAQIRERAHNLYITRQLLCTEAVMVTLNRSLGGGLSDAQAMALAAPFSAALGDSGCICGALSGAVLASGVFLGNHQPFRHRREMRESARQLHDNFKAANGATCCKVISRSVRHDRNAHFQKCADITAESAKFAATLILEKRPGLIKIADHGFIARRESKIGGAFKWLFRYFLQKA